MLLKGHFVIANPYRRNECHVLLAISGWNIQTNQTEKYADNSRCVYDIDTSSLCHDIFMCWGFNLIDTKFHGFVIHFHQSCATIAYITCPYPRNMLHPSFIFLKNPKCTEFTHNVINKSLKATAQICLLLEWQVTEGALNIINMAPLCIGLFSVASQMRSVRVLTAFV